MESNFKTKINTLKINLFWQHLIQKYKLNYAGTITHRINIKKMYKIGTKIKNKINNL